MAPCGDDNLSVSLSNDSIRNSAFPIDGEAARLAALSPFAAGENASDSGLDRIAEAVAYLLDVPRAAVTLVDESRSWVRSSYPSGERLEAPMERSLCRYALASPQAVTVISDGPAEPQLAGLTSAEGEPEIRFYAAAPLVTADGRAIGTLCAMDSVPRQLPPDRVELLRTLAAIALDRLDVQEKLYRANVVGRQLANVIKSSPVSVVTCDLDLRVTSWSPIAERVSG